MSLTFEQCREVVEKVWGWEITSLDGYYSVHWYPANGGMRSFTEPDLMAEIESWEGFGRTVEAMDRRGWTLRLEEGDSAIYYDFREDLKPKKTEDGYSILLPIYEAKGEDFTTRTLIEATHLAALEVVKQEDDKWNS